MLEPDAQNALDALRVNLSRSADCVKVYAAIILARLLRFGSHSTLADDRLDAKPPDDVRLIRFLSNGCGRTRRKDAILPAVL